MKILFITTANPNAQGDLLEMTILRGLREIMGEGLVDYPKKKIMYHDFSSSPKDALHGRGFSLLYTPLEDINENLRSGIFNQKFDAIIYGDGHIYGERVRVPEIDKLADGNSWVIDGHDLYGGAPIKLIYENEEVIGTQFTKCFKRELLGEVDLINKVHPTGFGIPEERILPLDLSVKNQMHQSTAPDFSLFKNINDLGGGFSHHKFTDENEYYQDLSKSWFGLTSKKGGWDTLRHYEILAAGSLLLFRDLDQKPKFCSPQEIPGVSYSTLEELNSLFSRLLPNGIPSDEYIDILHKQREWLMEHGTTKARAQKILQIIQDEKDTYN